MIEKQFTAHNNRNHEQSNLCSRVKESFLPPLTKVAQVSFENVSMADRSLGVEDPSCQNI